MKKEGWLPGLFRAIVHKAKEKLQGLIRSMKLPPKPLPKVDIDVYNSMVRVYKDISKHSDAVKKMNKEIVSLRQELEHSTGIFKAGKTPPKRKSPRPQKESIIEQLARLKKEAQEQPRQRKVPQRSSRDLER